MWGDYFFVSHDGNSDDSTAKTSGWVEFGTPNIVNGKVGKGTNYSQSNLGGASVADEYYRTTNTVIGGKKDHSVSVFFKADYADTGIVFSEREGVPVTSILNTRTVDITAKTRDDSANSVSPAYVTSYQNNWMHTVYTFDEATNDTGKLYVNGLLRDTETVDIGTITQTGYRVSIGAYYRGPSFGTFSGGLDGIIDELRISSIVRSADWVSAEYENQNSPGTFYSVGSEESRGAWNLSDGLVGHWSFDGSDIAGTTALDASVNGNDGTLVNTPTPTIGAMGQGLSFNGTDQYVDVGDTTETVRSIAFWINTNTLVNQKILDIDGTDQIEIDASSNIVATSFPGASVYVDSIATDDLTSGWHHVVITDTTGVSASNMDIGRIATSYFDGALDDVRIYERALSAAEISALYEQGSPDKMNASQNAKLTDGLVGLWSFDGPDVDWGDTGSEIKDRSGNNNNGAINGTITSSIGKIGQGLHFSGGSSHYVETSNNVLQELKDAGSVSLWGKYENHGGGLSIVFKIPGSANGSYCGDASNDNIRLGVGGAWYFEYEGYRNEHYTVVSTAPRNDEEWTHVVAVWEYNQPVRLYQDGIEYVGDVVTNYVSSCDTPAYFGAHNGFYGAGELHDGWFQGVLDDIRLYDRALSAEEVEELYRLGR